MASRVVTSTSVFVNFGRLFFLEPFLNGGFIPTFDSLVRGSEENAVNYCSKVITIVSVSTPM